MKASELISNVMKLVSQNFKVQNCNMCKLNHILRYDTLIYIYCTREKGVVQYTSLEKMITILIRFIYANKKKETEIKNIKRSCNVSHFLLLTTDNTD